MSKFGFEWIDGREPHYRVFDSNDNRVATCYRLENAELVTAALNSEELTAAKTQIEDLQLRIGELEDALDRSKDIPMKYKRMEFNAQLQDENNALGTALTAEREVLLAEQALSDKLEKALKVAKAFCDGLTAEECPDTVALPISAALAEVAHIRSQEVAAT